MTQLDEHPLTNRHWEGQLLRRTTKAAQGCLLLMCAASTSALLSLSDAAAEAPLEASRQTIRHKPSGRAVKASVPEAVTVAHRRLSGVEREKIKLASIPGGTSVINAQEVLKGRNLTNADALAFQPGVFAQSSGGGDGLRLSIRGSGIQTGSNYFRSGVLLMFDGLPVTTPAGTPYELFEPLGLQYTEVLRGANAFDYGGLQLGGAINYVTNTGYNSQVFQVRTEAGSFNYNKEQVSSGKVIGKADYYISLTDSYRGGYQQQTQATSLGVNANFGYKFSDRISTRFFFRYRQTQNGYAGYLTRNQILSDPQQIQTPYNTYRSKRIQPGSKFYGNMTTIDLSDNSQMKVGFDYQDAPIDIQQGQTTGNWGYKTLAGVLAYTRDDKIWGHDSDTEFGIDTYSDLDAWQTNRVRIPSGIYAGLPNGYVVRHSTYGGTDNYFHVRNNFQIVHNFWITTAGALAFIQRSTGVTYPTQSHVSQSSVNFAPRAGFRYQVTPKFELYGNVSRSIQPANDWQLLSGSVYTSGVAANMNSGGVKLDNQTATTFEVGSQGSFARNQWSISYYHSAVRNELLTVMTPQSQLYGTTVYSNASPTTHQGIEASLNTDLLSWRGNRISLRQAYTYQDFRFNHDATFGHNKLPGIPANFYQGEIHLDLKNGFYGGFSTQVSSKVSGAYDDTYYAPSYHIFNANLGYIWPKKHREIFLSFNNLANKHYAAIVVPGYKAAGTQLSVMQPGDGFGVVGGLSLGFN